MSGDELIVPDISNGILTIFQNDYPKIKELLDYKRDATLMFLKSKGAIAIYKGSLGLNVAKDVKDWDEFLEFSVSYTKSIVQAGLQKYQAEEDGLGDKKKSYHKIDLGLLTPAVEVISNTITREYFNKFPNWPSESGTQDGWIDLFVKSNLDANALRVYWLCRGTIYVKDTRYASPIKGCLYRAEFSGKPEFQISYFDLEKIKLCNELAKRNMNLIKKKIDELDEKYLTQEMNKLLISDFEL